MPRNAYQFATGVVTFGGSYVEHDAVDLDFPVDDGMTRQEFAEECDLNALMKRYERTGLLPQHPGREAFYGDFVDLPSYQEALSAIREAQDAFMSLPARVRLEFENDPARFVKFAEDPSNLDQMREWGLARPLDPPQAVEPAAPAPAPQAAPQPAGEPS